MMKQLFPKIGIFIIAYQASETLISAYQRIPTTFKKRAKEIYCFDDCSDDNTYYTGLGYKTANNIKNFNLYKNPKNLGYGGNQKKGYTYAIKKGLDVVVMLHGDVQYAPEKIDLILKPFLEGDSEKIGMVMGSRMLGDPKAGGMPLYKFIGNKVLTFLENKLLGTHLSEFHSGYRAYNMHALQSIPYKNCSNDFHFDTQMIILLLQAGYKIVELPIPTYYGKGSRSYVNVFKYGIDCLSTVIEYKLSNIGLKKDSFYSFNNNAQYKFKRSKYSSHMIIAQQLERTKAKTVLDVGCADGLLPKALSNKWKGSVVGIDKFSLNKGTEKNYSKFVLLDLNRQSLSDSIKEKFNSIVFADVLEHLKNPERNLLNAKELLDKNGQVIVSLPNPEFFPVLILHSLFPNFRMSHGPLDKTHLHFYNLKQAKDLLIKSNFEIKKIRFTAPILSIFSLSSRFNEKRLFYKFVSSLELLLIKIAPRFFSYQFIFVAEPTKA